MKKIAYIFIILLVASSCRARKKCRAYADKSVIESKEKI